MRREVGDGVEDLGAAVEPAHGRVADHTLEDQLRAVGGDRAQELVHRASDCSASGSVSQLVIIGSGTKRKLTPNSKTVVFNQNAAEPLQSS